MLKAVKFFILFILIVLPLKLFANDEGYVIKPLEEPKLIMDKVRLGEMIFHDESLSKNGKISCASCHGLNTGGTNWESKSTGVTGNKTKVNSPTVFNSGLNFVSFWDGRAGGLKEQIDGPVHHPDEMGTNWPEIIDKVKDKIEYSELFSTIYGGEISEETIKNAIVEFEESLVTVDSDFDLYLKGEEDRLSDKAKLGWQLFQDYGCASCHQGQNIGGNMYQKFGVIGGYFKDRGNITEADYGRFNVTKDKNDKFVFKVPSLRNIAVTPPYFHDGSAETLEDAVDVMVKYQLGIEIEPSEKEAIIEFLKSLTGKYKGKLLTAPPTAKK